MKIIWIDTETSGPDAFDQVIELGWVCSESKGSHLYKLPEHSEIHPSNSALTGITKDELDRDGLDMFVLPTVFVGKVWCSYNLQYDVDWINLTLLANEQPPLNDVPGVCLADVYKEYLDNNYPISMQRVLAIIKSERIVAHRAYQDALDHYHLFQHIKNNAPLLLKKHLKLHNPKPV